MAIVKKDNSHNPFKVDEGIYKAIITSIDEKDGNNGPYLLWSFKIPQPLVNTKPVDEPMSVGGFTPLIVQDNSKLDKWLKACNVNVEEDGDEFDTEDLIGRKVQILVENKVNKKNGQEQSQVTKLMRSVAVSASQQDEAPAKKKPMQQQKTAPKEEEVEEDPIEEPPTKKKPMQQQKTAPKEEEPDSDNMADESMWDFGDDTP